MGQFNKGRRTLFVENESTPGTTEVFSAANGDIRPYDISLSPNLEAVEKFYASGDFDNFPSNIGMREGTIEFKHDFNPISTVSVGASLSVPPKWKQLMYSGGLQSGTGASLWQAEVGVTNTFKPSTLLLQLSREGNPNSVAGLGITLTGAMCTISILMEKVGQTITGTFAFTGALSIADIAAGSILIPSAQSTVKAPGVLSATISAFGAVIDIARVQIDLNQVLAQKPDPSKDTGILGFNVTKITPKITCNPSMKRDTAGDGFWTKWIDETEGAFNLTWGKTLHMIAPKIQLINGFGEDDIDGNMRNPVEFICNRDATNPSFRLKQAAVA